MTSKISFSKMCKENMKRSMAVIFCTIFIFLMELLAFVIMLQNVFAQDFKGKELLEMIESTVAPRLAYHLIAMLIGLYLAYQGFGYLHNKMQTDFYDSLPVKRSTHYWMILRNDLLLFLVPLILISLCKIIILAVIGQLTGAIVLLVLKSVAYQFLAASAMWVTAVLAIMLTGHMLVGGLGCGVFVIYMPILIRNLIPAYASTFFYTYMMDYSGSTGKYCSYFSPARLVLGLTRAEKPTTFVVGILLWIILVGIIGYMLYLRRPAEAAGRSMAFEKANPVIRFLIVIPMALYSGLYVSQMSLQSSKIWLAVGIFVGAFLFHGIVEAIYQFDIRGIFSYKKQLAFTWVLCLGFTAVFLFDLTGFDRWVPQKDEVASVDISLDNMTFEEGVYWGEEPNGMSGEAVGTVLDLIQSAVTKEESQKLKDQPLVTVQVKYQMKNGSQKSRRYLIDDKKSEELIAKVFENRDFKDDYFSLYTADRSKIKRIIWDNTIDYETLNFTRKEQNEFLDIYLEELSNMTYSELKANYPCEEFVIETEKVACPKLNGYRTGVEETYYIYPTFRKTLAYLEEHGKNIKRIGDYEISKIEVEHFDDDYQTDKTNTIKNKEVIEKYKDELVYTDMCGFYNGYGNASQYSVRVTVLAPESYVISAEVSEETAGKMMKE